MMQDIYAGSSLKGIERGTVKKLRIVELIFRNTGIGKQMASGPGAALCRNHSRGYGRRVLGCQTGIGHRRGDGRRLRLFRGAGTHSSLFSGTRLVGSCRGDDA